LPQGSNTRAVIPSAGADLAAENARPRRESEDLRMERGILKKAARFPGSAGMKLYLNADQRETFVVRVMGNVPGVSASGYYAWRGRPESPRKAANRALLTEIGLNHAAQLGRYGAPRIHAALRAGGAYRASRGRADRLPGLLPNPGGHPPQLVRLDRRIPQSQRLHSALSLKWPPILGPVA
jgi:hypothetical protein